MYTSFARVYDKLMDTVEYAAWAEHYQQLMNACHVPAKGRCVECACGTGNLTLPLRKMGYQMTGVDLSEEMLAAAMEKARAAGAMIPFIRQDMRNLTVPRRADCVLATCDGVNYLTTPEDVQAFCKDKISWFKIPKYVHFLDVFPMTASQKIQKYKLREMAHELWPDA